MKDASFLVNGQRVKGTLVVPKTMGSKKPAVFFVHGMTSSERGYVPMAQKCAEQGMVGLTLSLRGHGRSEGKLNNLTVGDLVEDGIAAYDFLASKAFVDKTRIGICGSSVGATVAVLTAAKRHVASLVLRAPAVYSEKMMNMSLGQIMEKEREIFTEVGDLEKTPSVEAIRKYEGSLLIIPSERDEVIPMIIPQTIFEKATRTKHKEIKIIPEAIHGLSKSTWRKQFISLTVDWLANYL